MLANISKLHDRIWTGGDLDPRDRVARAQLSDIIDSGITHIVDLRLEWSDQLRVAGFNLDSTPEYHWLGVDDDGSDLGPRSWEAGLNYVYEVLDEDPEHVVLIHCHMGVNRAPSLAALAVQYVNGGIGVDVWNAIREVRPIAWAIYYPEGLRHVGLDTEADEVAEAIKKANKYGDMEKGIGRIRSLQKVGTVINGESLWDEL